MQKRMTLAVVTLIGFGCNAAAVSAKGGNAGVDSANFQMIRQVQIVKPPVLPHAMADTTQCIEAKNLKAVIAVNSGGTKGWKSSNCPKGYLPYGLSTKVATGGVPMTGLNGEFNWHYYCCKIKMTYVG